MRECLKALLVAGAILSDICFIHVKAYAVSEIALNPTKVIETVIGAGELNRVQVKGNEILEVVGNENKYQLYWSRDWHNLFIVPKAEVGEIIDISLILGSGNTQDIRFTVGDTKGQTVVIGANIADKDDKDKNIEARLMMQAMSDDTRSKYYVTDLKHTIFKNSSLDIKQLQVWKYRGLTGSVFEARNLGKGRLKLEEDKLRGFFKNIVAFNIEALFLVQGGTSKIFVITKDMDKYDN